MVHDEVALTIERTNGLLASMGVVVNAAGHAIMSKDGGEHFKKLINQLTGD